MDLAAWGASQRTRGLSAATIRRRNISMRSLMRFSNGGPITTGVIEQWLGQFESASTRRAYLADVRAYSRWAVRRALWTTDPTSDLDPVKAPNRLPRPISDFDLERVMTVAPARLRAAVALAAWAGLRRAEIVNLEWVDVDLLSDPPTVTVRGGKGGVDRTIPVHPRLRSELMRLMRGQGRVVPITADYLGVQIARLFAELDIEGGIHRCRHRFGTELARATGGNILVVARAMGHASTITTMGYVALSGAMLDEAIRSMVG
jgi:integrase